MRPEENQSIAVGNMHRKFGEVKTYVEICMWTDRRASLFTIFCSPTLVEVIIISIYLSVNEHSHYLFSIDNVNCEMLMRLVHPATC